MPVSTSKMEHEEHVEITDNLELAVRELILTVESSQPLIDDLEMQVQQLKLKLESQEIHYKKLIEDKDAAYATKEAAHATELALQLKKSQEDLDYYFLLSRKQYETIQEGEKLQARFADLLARIEG